MICSKFANEQGWTYFKNCILVRHYSCRHLENKICQTSRPLSPSRLPLRAHFHQKRDLWVRGRKQLVLFSRESWCFPRRSRGKDQDSKCFVIFLDSHLHSNKRITGANQNSRLATYNNTNLILQTTEWMIYKQKYFPYIICIFFLH